MQASGIAATAPPAPSKRRGIANAGNAIPGFGCGPGRGRALYGAFASATPRAALARRLLDKAMELAMTDAISDFRGATRSPQAFHAWAGTTAPWFGVAALGFIAAGVAGGMFLTPASAWQSDAHRILFVRLPAAWISFAVYGAIAALSILVLRVDNRLASTLSSALAPTGMLFAVLALWSGAMWGKPLLGTWWGWDSQSVCVLLVLFLYGGFVALKAMIEEPRRAERAGALIALVGGAHLPVLYFSIQWWEVSRHVTAASHSVPASTPSIFATLALVTLGFAAYATFAALMRARLLIAEREWQARSAHLLRENTQ